jgi:spore germination protein YaaH
MAVFQVLASADDARNINGGTSKSINATTQHLGKFSTTDYWNGWRFNNVTIPQGATIQSATLDLYSAQVTSGTTAKVIFYGVDEDDTAAFNTSTSYPEGKTRTTASVTKDFTVSEWSALGFGVDLVDVTTLIQEIVDRAGWESGNDLAIVAHDNGSSDNNYIGYSTYDRATDRGAKLTITLDAGITAPSDCSGTQSGNTIEVTWTDNSDNEDNFVLERKRGDSPNYYQIATLAADAESYTDSDVDAGYTYTYRIKAVNTGGDSTYSTSDPVAMSGTKAWTSRVQAWIYPGFPAENADEEYSDGRIIHTLKPEYFTIEEDGTISLLEEDVDHQNAYTQANVAEIKTYSDDQYVTVSGSYPNFFSLIGDETNEPAAIETLVDFVVDNGMTGVELDWEGYGSWSAQEYADYKTFVATLGTALHAEGKKLMIDGPPITNSTEQALYEWKYEDFESMTEVDYLCMMLYDYQYDYGAGESVQPATWAQNGCAWIRSKISDIDRIIVGIPSYGYHGTTEGFVITIDTKAQSSAFTGYDTATRNDDDEMEWVNSGTSYLYQDTTGMNSKRERIEDEGIKHISVWHLGGNDWFSGKTEEALQEDEEATAIKTLLGVAVGDIKSVNGTAIANVKAIGGVSNV